MEDICYSFWVGSALGALHAAHVCSEDWFHFFLMCQHAGGGLMKSPAHEDADPVHTSQGLVALHLLPWGGRLPSPALAEKSLLLPAGFLTSTVTDGV